MTITNILNEAVYKDKTITANKILKELHNHLNTRRFGLNLKDYFGNAGVIDFNNESFSINKEENLVVVHMPKNLTYEFLKSKFSKFPEDKIKKLWEDYKDKYYSVSGLNISKYFGGKKTYLVVKNDKNHNNRGEANTTLNKSAALIILYPKVIEGGDENISQILQHEITHILDFHRGNLSRTKNPKVDPNKSEMENYYSSIYEFNRFVQLISDKKKRSKRIRERLNSIRTVEELKNFLQDEAYDRTAEAFINNKELFHKLIKRLHREKLINFEVSNDK